MELRRTLIIIAMAVVGYMLVLAWQKDYGTPAATAAVTEPAANTAAADVPKAAPAQGTGNADVPQAPVTTKPAETPTLAAATTPASGLISVKTDVFNISIDPVGGDIVNLSLPEYTKSVDSKEPFALLETDNARTYIAQSGLTGANGPDQSSAGRPHYSASAAQFALQPSQNALDVVLSLPAQNGVQIQKIFHFQRGSYVLDVSYHIVNQGSTPWVGNMFGQLKRDSSKDPSAGGSRFGMSTFLGGAWWTPEKSYNKRSFKDFADKPLKEDVKGGWAAIVQHYFVAAWVPAKDSENSYTTRSSNGNYFIGFTGSSVQVAPGKDATIGAQLYAGPKIQDSLRTVSPGLELTVDYGWLWFLAQGLFWLLTHIHALIGNWGWSIVLLTVLVKAVFFPLSASSYRSMANMRRVMPQMQRMKEQFGDDRQKLSQAMMELYKKEKINPLGGCLPIVIQMPVFLALYWTLMESVELRHASWMWIHDLSVMDPVFALPIFMGLTMLVQQQLNPAPQDPTQAKVMKMMPIIFTFMFLWFPAGLVLYWCVNNLLSITQQWIITKQIDKSVAKA